MSDYSESEQSDYESQEDSFIEKPKSKKKKMLVIPTNGAPPANARITINLALTHYDVIEDVAEELEWKVQRKMKAGKAWDVLWTDHHIQPELLFKLQLYQKVSHFPGIHVLSRKNLLGLSLMDMYKRSPTHYDFFPKTWLLPSQYGQLRKQFSLEQKIKTFIVKPEADCQGRGIFLTQNIQEVGNGGHYVVQEYISKPLLIDKLKFDFRVYVLLCGVSPLRLYVYKEGLARFATEHYVEPNKHNLKKQFIHLTNYAVNKKNPKFVYNSSSQRMDVGHKRALSSVLEIIQKRGYNIYEVQAEINKAIVKTLLLGHPLAAHQYRFCQPNDENRNMCFHILGIDIMLDENCKPYVLEVNHTPSFVTDTPLDRFIKYGLIKDTLILMNITPSSRAKAVEKMNQISKQKSVGKAKRQLYQNLDKQQRVKQAQEDRNKYESQNFGGFTRVYPVDDVEEMWLYEELLELAEKSYFSENNVLRAQMDRQKASEEANNKDKGKDTDKYERSKSIQVQEESFITMSPPKMKKIISATDHVLKQSRGSDYQFQAKNSPIKREKHSITLDNNSKNKTKQLQKQLAPFGLKGQTKNLRLSIRKCPSGVAKKGKGYSKLLPKIGHDAPVTTSLKRQPVVMSPYQTKKMKSIKLVDKERNNSGKTEEARNSIRRQAPSKMLRKSVEDISDEKKDDDD